MIQNYVNVIINFKTLEKTSIHHIGVEEFFNKLYKEYVKKEQTSITFLPEKTSYPTETTVCLMFSLSDQDTLPVTYHTPTGVFLFGEDGVQVSADTTVYEKQTDDSLPSLTSQDIEHLQEGGHPDTSDSPEAPDTESGSGSVPSEDAKDTNKEVQP